jgi:hypothetical protein
LIFPDEAVELALDPLGATTLAVGELAVKIVAYFIPLLAEVDAVVPDEVHLLFIVFEPWQPPSVRTINARA